MLVLLNKLSKLKYSKSPFYSRTSKNLNISSINPNCLKVSYAVRGSVVNKALSISEKLIKDPNSFPFKKIFMCNIGNPQELGQKPITFVRQVVAACLYPTMINKNIFPKDVIERAYKIIGGHSGSLGAYTHSQGLEVVRKSISDYIEERDGYPSNPDDIFLSDGASPAIKIILNMIISSNKDGILIPIPQYPLYSATVNQYGGSIVGYYLDEDNGWSINLQEIKRAFTDSTKKGITPKAICIINPGNPTGQIISEKNLKEIIKYCHEKGLTILSDEVYQTNVYDDSTEWVSMKKIVRKMGEKYRDINLFSFNSISKGMFGECGIRGGYVEITNISRDIKNQILKLFSVNLCPNVMGQVATEVSINPPKENEPSHKLFKKEIKLNYESLKRRAIKVSNKLSAIKGIKCQKVNGAMYAFPSIELPNKFLEEVRTKYKGVKADERYCLDLLENTGICVVPGSGFHQKKGTYHFRITILPSEKDIESVLESLRRFHLDFLKKYNN